MNYKALSMIPVLLLFVVIDTVIGVAVHIWTPNRIASMIFINLSFLMILIGTVMVSCGKNRYLYAGTNIILASGYAIAELILGCIFIFINIEGVLPVLIQSVIFVLFLALFIANALTNHHSNNLNEMKQENMGHILDIQNLLKNAMNASSSRETHKLVERAYTKMRTVRGFTDGKYQNIDSDISNVAEMIRAKATTDDLDELKKLVDELCSLVDERNSM